MTSKTNKSLLKGVYTLNPTQMVMKQGSAKAKKATSRASTKPARKMKNQGKIK